jgi:Mg/Co/Ni transporter MgtE
VTPSGATGESQSAEHLIAAYSELHPVDLAASILDLPDERRIEVAGGLSDERLADALEEMPETEQIEILSGMNDERVADVLDNMEPDDAADLLAQLPSDRSQQILDLMDPDEAEDVRFLLSYAPDTAGGLMSTEPIIVSAETTVAEGLAIIRRSEITPAMAASVCVTLPPFESPTGRFLGIVHFQRMLRHPPQTQLGTILDTGADPLLDSAPLGDVARTFASYNLVSLPVVGSVTAIACSRHSPVAIRARIAVEDTSTGAISTTCHSTPESSRRGCPGRVTATIVTDPARSR